MHFISVWKVVGRDTNQDRREKEGEVREAEEASTQAWMEARREAEREAGGRKAN